MYCSITGFGPDGPHVQRAGHDLNYLGWAGVLEDTPTWPPLQIADLAAGGLGAVTDVLAALVRRSRTGAGARVNVSMTHRSQRLNEHRLAESVVPGMLTGGLACYGCMRPRTVPPDARRPRAEVLRPSMQLSLGPSSQGGSSKMPRTARRRARRVVARAPSTSGSRSSTARTSASGR